MPAISTGNVLMTGTNGFIGSWALKLFLESGFTVKAPVRSEGKASYLEKVFSAYGDKLEFVIIPDITKEGAFDAATVGVDAVIHIASPASTQTTRTNRLSPPSTVPSVSSAPLPKCTRSSGWSIYPLAPPFWIRQRLGREYITRTTGTSTMWTPVRGRVARLLSTLSTAQARHLRSAARGSSGKRTRRRARSDGTWSRSVRLGSSGRSSTSTREDRTA
ncbi:hypothetical protein BD309DRAFT_1051324 [Dichomitus squalens]|nr:hypothetical protein BD309DRAFT_1051324 [Dichomitus squalens]